MLLHAVKAALRKLRATRASSTALRSATAVATFLLILIGGLVHGTGSSLACPDWPTCYGRFMPKMEGGVLVEHSHRLAAGTVVIMTLVLATMLTASKAPAELRPLRPVRLAGGGPGVRAGAAGRHHRHPAAAHAGVDRAHGDVAAVLPDAWSTSPSARARRRATRAAPLPAVGPAPGAGGGRRRLLPDGAGRPGPALGRRARLHRRPAVPRLAVARRAPDGARSRRCTG